MSTARSAAAAIRPAPGRLAVARTSRARTGRTRSPPGPGSSPAIIGQVDGWLTREFAPHRLAETIRDLAAGQQPDMTRDVRGDDGIARKSADCDAKLAQYRAALDAEANSATVATWIAETEAERAAHELAMRRYEPQPRRMTETEIKAIVDKLADIARVLPNVLLRSRVDVCLAVAQNGLF